jgi:hypothetical protein
MKIKDSIRVTSTKSGKDFLEILRPKFIKAVEENHSILIDLDDAFLFPAHFVSDSFGKLAKEFGPNKVMEHLKIKSVKRSIRLNMIIAVLYGTKK